MASNMRTSPATIQGFLVNKTVPATLFFISANLKQTFENHFSRIWGRKFISYALSNLNINLSILKAAGFIGYSQKSSPAFKRNLDLSFR